MKAHNNHRSGVPHASDDFGWLRTGVSKVLKFASSLTPPSGIGAIANFCTEYKITRHLGRGSEVRRSTGLRTNIKTGSLDWIFLRNFIQSDRQTDRAHSNNIFGKFVHKWLHGAGRKFSWLEVIWRTAAANAANGRIEVKGKIACKRDGVPLLPPRAAYVVRGWTLKKIKSQMILHDR